MALVSNTELKALLDIENDNAALTIIASYVQSLFESFLCRYLEEDTYKETFFYAGYQLPLYGPVKKIKTVYVNGIETSGYQLGPDCLFVYNAKNNDVVTVSYVGGYAEVPGVIKKAAIDQCIHEFKRRDNPDVVSVKTANTTMTYANEAGGLLESVKKMIQPYRNYAVIGI
jgi:hypothetical protein